MSFSPALTFSALVLGNAVLIPSYTVLAQTGESAALSPAQIRVPRLTTSYGGLPLSFEANRGQSDPQIRFLSRGNGYSLFLTDSSAVLTLTQAERTKTGPGSRSCPLVASRCDAVKENSATGSETRSDVVRMELAGAQRGLKVEGAEPLPGTANYLIGNDPAKWHTNVPTYAKVKYSNVYPGIDLVYYGNQQQLEYDFVIAPGADPKQVRLHFSGAEKLKLNSDGDVEVMAKSGEIAFRKPVIYQLRDGIRQPVKGNFELVAENTITFRLGDYDRNRALVIDPTVVYSTFLGGSGQGSSGAFGDSSRGIAVDAAGSAYVVGSTWSTDFPVVAGSYTTQDPGVTNGSFVTSVGFVSKLNAAGTALVYSTYIGGNGSSGYNGNNVNGGGGDAIYGIALDSAGNAYLTGSTWSSNFPVTTGAFQSTNKSFPYGYDAWVAKLNPSGSSLVYSTYLGGTGLKDGTANGYGDYGISIAVNDSGNAYVAGAARSDDFPVTSGALQQTNHGAANHGANAWIAEINSTGTDLVYSTYLGGSGNAIYAQFIPLDAASGIAIEKAGDAFVTGDTVSTDFPVTSGAFQAVNKAAASLLTTGFVSEINATGTALVYSTLLGGSGGIGVPNGYGTNFGDTPYAIKLDALGDAFVAGDTGSSDFPVTDGAFQPVNNGESTKRPNSFISKLNPTGTQLIYSTYLGGSGNSVSGDVAESLALDALGDAYVAGYSFSSDFPTTTGAYQSSNEGAANHAPNAFVTEINPLGTGLIYSTYIGGTGSSAGLGDGAAGIAVDSSGGIYITGTAYSSGYPTSTGAFQPKNHGAATGNSNVFVTKIAPEGLQFIPVTPCRIVDTRNPSGPFGGPEMTAGQSREFDIPQSACNIPSTAVAYSLNVTVVPNGSLNYLTLWPSGQPQPNASTLNSDGGVKANAAIVPAGSNGGVSVFVTDPTQVILDIDGYFVPVGTTGGLAFFPVTPCRIADTRNVAGPLGGPYMPAQASRAFPVLSSSCALPSAAQAYSLNVTAVPHSTLNYLTIWPTGEAQPNVSTLNSSTGAVMANAAIVPSGTSGEISVFVSDAADVILDVDGYFAPPGSGGLSLYTASPCRVIDTRPNAFDGSMTVNVQSSSCAPPSTAQAYVLNATVVPSGALNYLSLWPDGAAQPNVSTLNADDGAIASNMAIVPTTNGSVDAFADGSTNLILDFSGYFAP